MLDDQIARNHQPGSDRRAYLLRTRRFSSRAEEVIAAYVKLTTPAETSNE